MEKIMYITTDNSVEVKEINEIEYDTLYEGVNGLVELVSLNRDVDMWVNEEGKLIGLEPNLLATILWSKVFPNQDVIMGNVVITGGADTEGNTTGLSDDSIVEILNLIEDGLNEAFKESE